VDGEKTLSDFLREFKLAKPIDKWERKPVYNCFVEDKSKAIQKKT
jgi:hypothetical protein